MRKAQLSDTDRRFPAIAAKRLAAIGAETGDVVHVIGTWAVAGWQAAMRELDVLEDEYEVQR